MCGKQSRRSALKRWDSRLRLLWTALVGVFVLTKPLMGKFAEFILHPEGLSLFWLGVPLILLHLWSFTQFTDDPEERPNWLFAAAVGLAVYAASLPTRDDSELVLAVLLAVSLCPAVWTSDSNMSQKWLAAMFPVVLFTLVGWFICNSINLINHYLDEAVQYLFSSESLHGYVLFDTSTIGTYMAMLLGIVVGRGVAADKRRQNEPHHNATEAFWISGFLCASLFSLFGWWYLGRALIQEWGLHASAAQCVAALSSFIIAVLIVALPGRYIFSSRPISRGQLKRMFLPILGLSCLVTLFHLFFAAAVRSALLSTDFLFGYMSFLHLFAGIGLGISTWLSLYILTTLPAGSAAKKIVGVGHEEHN